MRDLLLPRREYGRPDELLVVRRLRRVELVNLFGNHGYGVDTMMMYDLRLSHRLHRADSDSVYELCLTAEAAGTKRNGNN